MKKAMRKKRLGFSLMEITIAILVLGFGLLPVLSVFMQGSKFVEKGELYLRASIAAQNLLDLARSDDFIWERVPNKVHVTNGAGNYPQFKLPESFIKKHKANATITVDQVQGATTVGTGLQENRLLQISVKINWYEKEIEKNLTLTTYKALLDSVSVKTSTRM